MLRYLPVSLCSLISASQGDGEAGKRQSKLSKRLNEEISSDSENERWEVASSWPSATPFSDCIFRLSISNVVACKLPFCCSSDQVVKKQRKDGDEEIEETAQEKKLRLAKLYLDQLREEGEYIS